MRLETAAAKLERSRKLGDIDMAEHVDLLREAARRIKALDSCLFAATGVGVDGLHEIYACDND